MSIKMKCTKRRAQKNDCSSFLFERQISALTETVQFPPEAAHRQPRPLLQEWSPRVFVVSGGWVSQFSVFIFPPRAPYFGNELRIGRFISIISSHFSGALRGRPTFREDPVTSRDQLPSAPDGSFPNCALPVTWTGHFSLWENFKGPPFAGSREIPRAETTSQKDISLKNENFESAEEAFRLMENRFSFPGGAGRSGGARRSRKSFPS